MEEARKKLRVCLIFVVTLAVVVGILYYLGELNGQNTLTDGTLVKAAQFHSDFINTGSKS